MIRGGNIAEEMEGWGQQASKGGRIGGGIKRTGADNRGPANGQALQVREHLPEIPISIKTGITRTERHTSQSLPREANQSHIAKPSKGSQPKPAGRGPPEAKARGSRLLARRAGTGNPAVSSPTPTARPARFEIDEGRNSEAARNRGPRAPDPVPGPADRPFGPRREERGVGLRIATVLKDRAGTALYRQAAPRRTSTARASKGDRTHRRGRMKRCGQEEQFKTLLSCQ